MHAKYEQLVKSGATAISSEMMFGTDTKDSKQRWSTPAQSLSTFGEKLQDHLIVARTSFGSGEHREILKQKAEQIYEKG